MYYLIYVKKVPEILTGAMAVGIRIHEELEKSFWVRDKQTGLLRPHYKDAEAFANAAKAKFDYIARRGTLRGKKIEWKDDREKYILSNDVRDICRKVYNTIVSDGPPLAAEYEIKPFQIDGRWFNGRIDEIRIDKETGAPLIRDFKTGTRRPGEMKKKYDPQATIYCLFLGVACNQDKNIAEKLGITEEEAKQFAGNPIYLSDRIVMQYYFMRENELIPMPRSDIQYKDLCNMID